MLTRDQRYAADAVMRVQQVRDDTTYRKEYKKMAQELPIMVRSAGLVQALTFVQSRDKDAHKQVLEDVAHTLGYANTAKLVEDSRSAHLAEYVRLTERVIDALQWYKRLAQVEFDEP